MKLRDKKKGFPKKNRDPYVLTAADQRRLAAAQAYVARIIASGAYSSPPSQSDEAPSQGEKHYSGVMAGPLRRRS